MTTLTTAAPAALADHLDDPLDGLKIIDCDAHFTEPPDLWTSRVSAKLADQMPVQRTVDGITSWYLGGTPWASTGGNAIAQGRAKEFGRHTMQPFEAIDPSAWDVAERLALMDEAGIHAAIIYPNGMGFSSNHVFAIEDMALRRHVLTIYNDFFVDIQEESGRRLLPQAILPIWDMDLTVAEINRLLDRGVTGFTLSDRPELLGLPELHESYFAPMWALLDESGTVANFHISSGAKREDLEAGRSSQWFEKPKDAPRVTPTVASPAWSCFGKQRRLAVASSQAFMSNVRILSNLCLGDMFDRYPNLKVVSAESGIGWIPFMLESMEYQLDEMVADPTERAFQKRRPTEYFRDHIYVMYWFERIAPQKLIEDIGVGNVLVETDVPHPTCLYPGAREHFAASLAGLDEHVRRRVVQDNAAELYGIVL